MSIKSTKSSWDPWKMFDASKQEIELAKKRQEMQLAKKAELRRLAANPFGGGPGGAILDKAMQRWYSARSTASDHFKISRKTTPVAFWAFIIPVSILLYRIITKRAKREASYRRGEVSMLDKSYNKFLY